jgi:multicomponent Na+:H+ antiporter subunit D
MNAPGGWLAIAAVVLPIVGAVSIALAGEKRGRARLAIALTVPVSVVLLVVTMLRLLEAGRPVAITAWQVGPILTLRFSADRLGLLFAGVASTLWVATTIYSHGYLAGGPNLRRYFAYLSMSLTATMGVALAGNLFTLYIFYELLSLVTYPLVIHDQTRDAARSGRTYITYSLCGAALVLLGMVGTMALSGSLDFRQGGLLAGIEPGGLVGLTAFCFIAGFGVKAAVMPLHGWLPQAMVAPTPVSALLHAVAVVKSGVFGILRVLLFVVGKDLMADAGIGSALSAVIALSILLGSLSALREDTLKRRLAFSTVSQLGYITLGVTMLNPEGMTGGLAHMLNHAVMKIVLFFCAGILISVTGRTKVSQLDGIGRRMPLTMGAFTIAALGMVGVPPVCGYVSKWYLLRGAVHGGQWALAGVLVGSSFMNAAYFFPIAIRAFLRPYVVNTPAAGPDGGDGSGHGHGGHGHDGHLGPSEHGQGHGHGHGHGGMQTRGGGEAPAAMLWPVLVLALGSVLLGIWSALPINFVTMLVKGI